MLEWPDGPRLFEHLRDLPTPLRVADLPGEAPPILESWSDDRRLHDMALKTTPWRRTLNAERRGSVLIGECT